jgi:transposase
MDQRMLRTTHMGLDVHKHFSRTTARDASGAVVFRSRLEHADRVKLREQLSQLPRGTPVILEGTFGWGWMTEELQACGLDPHLTSGSKTKDWRKALGKAKNNRLDADLLSELWREPKRWWEVWLAPREVRERREWLRHRMGLVQTQSVLKNRMQAVLHRHGILHPFSDLFGKQGLRHVRELIESADGRLPESAKVTLSGNLKVLEQTRREIASVTRQLRGQIAKDPAAQLWDTLPGVGWVLAYTIQAEIGDLSRFKNARHLASYSLLAPRDNDSGDEDPEAAPTGRRVGRVGRRTLKRAFLQAALGAIRRSPRLRALYDRRTEGGKKRRGQGQMAVAHELCRIGYSCVKHQRPYEEDARPERPGRMRETTRRNSHSAPGQPETAMVPTA